MKQIQFRKEKFEEKNNEWRLIELIRKDTRNQINISKLFIVERI